MNARTICVVTATRAEYGLLYWLLDELRQDPAVELQLLVTGAHLSERFGMTARQIERDGFTISARVPLPLEDDSVLGVTRALAHATQGIAEALGQLRPELLVLLGDRYEMLAAAQAAMLARIPIAHVHGGEATEGLVDEAIRHSITKMSHLHFVAAEPFWRRVVQMGEDPDHVWMVGATGLDNIERVPRLDRSTLEADLELELRAPSFLVTYHPETLSAVDQGEAMCALLGVLDETGGSIVITGVNADTGAGAIRRVAEAFARARPDRVRLVETLGVQRYLSLMSHVDAVVGNSSSGLIEAPAMGRPTLDIGDRQRGRPRAASVVHCAPDPDSLRRGLALVLSPAHQALSARCESCYGSPGAAERIAGVLRSQPLEGLVMKRFHDQGKS